ncbi:MAG: class I SAM-dependent methyltransferase, partial [Omnitrophica WOR_2 bacterium]
PLRLSTTNDRRKTMERAEWLKKMRSMAESLYDHISPQYWVTYGYYENQTHLEYLQKFLGRVHKAGLILSAGCGAGRYDGLLLEAGYSVVGIDQSAGMLRRAREHFPPEQFPQLRYEKMGLQEMDFNAEFDGAICMDTMEHICPEDWPVILRNFKKALKPGGVLYFTSDWGESNEMEASYQRAKALGLPVVYGEVVDELDAAYEQAKAGGPLLDASVYHYHPPLEQVRVWIGQAGLTIEEIGKGKEYYHIVVKNSV